MEGVFDMKKYQAVEIEIMYLSQEDVLSSLSQEWQDDSFDGGEL